MALPFILGVVIGGGAVYAYNNREELSRQVQAKSKDLKANLKKGRKTLEKVSNSLKNKAQNLTKNLKSDDTKSVKKKIVKKSPAKRKVDKNAQSVALRKVAKSAKPTTIAPDLENKG